MFTLCIGLWCHAMAVAEQKSPEALEKEFQKESNPRKQANLAREMMILRLQLLRARIATGTMLEESSPELTAYQVALERLASAVRAADHAGTSKTAEQHLRDQIHELDSVKMNVSFTERPYLERIVTRAGVLREEILYSLMHPASGSKNKASAEPAQGDASSK